METNMNIQTSTEVIIWVKAAKVSDVPEDGGAAVKIDGKQIAIFNFKTRGEWYATQNLCPHRFEMVLSRGLIGDTGGEPKVACPLHKNAFSLKTGQCLTGAPYQIDVFPVKIEDGFVYIGNV